MFVFCLYLQLTMGGSWFWLTLISYVMPLAIPSLNYFVSNNFQQMPPWIILVWRRSNYEFQSWFSFSQPLFKFFSIISIRGILVIKPYKTFYFIYSRENIWSPYLIPLWDVSYDDRSERWFHQRNIWLWQPHIALGFMTGSRLEASLLLIPWHDQ